MENKLLTVNEDFNQLELIYKKVGNGIIGKRVASSLNAFELFKNVWNKDSIDIHETFAVLFITGNNIVGYSVISQGGITSTAVDVRLLFVKALLAKSTSIIIAHNHPSGNLNPSEQDKGLTERIVKAGKLLDITVLDHMIITENSYYSFADENEYSLN